MKIDRKKEFRDMSAADKIRHLRGTRVAREFAITRDGLDTEARTAWLSIASEQPYERWWGVEILDLGKASIRDQRLRSGAPLLVGHDTADQVGVIERFAIDSDRKLRILARFGKSARAEEIWQDVLDGIRRNTSVGYVIHDMVLEKQTGDVNTYRVTDWEPYEGSLVAVPADPTVGLGRHQTNSRNNIMEHEEIEHETERKSRSELRGEAAEARRMQQLYAAGETFRHNGGAELARELINAGGSVETFNARMLERMRGAQKVTATAQIHETPYGQGARQILAPSKVFKREEDAFLSGQFLRALYGKEDAISWCREQGIEQRAMSASVLSQGGIVVPDVLSQQIIDLSDSYGAFRQNGDSWPMSSDSLHVPRSAADPEASFVGESEDIPESDPSWDGVTLTAKKIGVIVRVPTELMEDSVIPLADRIAFQIARSFAKKEDLCGFLGDGTSTYGRMQGIFTKLVNGSHNAGKVLATSAHDTFAEIDGVDLANLMAALPEYALEGAKWYCSGTAFGLVFGRLMLGASGNSAADLGAPVPRSYNGFPVVTSPILPAGASTDYSGQVMIAFGNLRLSSKFGSRREIRVQILTERYAEKDQIGIKATERFDIVNHDLGNNTVAGPMVGLVGN